MNVPLITWLCVAAIAVLAVVVKFLSAFLAKDHHVKNPLAMASDGEMFFIPGDPDPKKAADFDFDD